jgi:hypothetical protein
MLCTVLCVGGKGALPALRTGNSDSSCCSNSSKRATAACSHACCCPCPSPPHTHTHTHTGAGAGADVQQLLLSQEVSLQLKEELPAALAAAGIMLGATLLCPAAGVDAAPPDGSSGSGVLRLTCMRAR